MTIVNFDSDHEDLSDFPNDKVEICVELVKKFEQIMINNKDEYEKFKLNGLTEWQKNELYEILVKVLNKYTNNLTFSTKTAKNITYSITAMSYSLTRSSIWSKLLEYATSEDISALLFENIYWQLGLDNTHSDHLLSEYEDWADFSIIDNSNKNDTN